MTLVVLQTKNPYPNVDAASGCVLYHYGLTQFKVCFIILRRMIAGSVATHVVLHRDLWCLESSRLPDATRLGTRYALTLLLQMTAGLPHAQLSASPLNAPSVSVSSQLVFCPDILMDPCAALSMDVIDTLVKQP